MFIFELDFAPGNYDVLLANIGVLTASSFLLTVGHLSRALPLYGLTFVLGLTFLLNQVDELFSFLALSGPEESSLVLLCLYAHLSHLVLSLILFAKALVRSTDFFSDNHLLFVSAYWHLVEMVWIIILLALAGI